MSLFSSIRIGHLRSWIGGVFVSMLIVLGGAECISAFAYEWGSPILEGSPNSVGERWSFHSTDTKILPRSWQTRQESVVDDAHIDSTTIRCERIDFYCGKGTEVLLACDIEPTLVIPELQFHLKGKSSQGFLQMMVEVTLPRTPSPTGDGPLKTLVRGPIVNLADQWQLLEFGPDGKSLEAAIDEQVWILRRKYGIAIDKQMAFVERVLVNVYTRPGPHRVWLGEPKVTGAVTPNARVIATAPIRDFNVQRIGFAQDETRQPAPARREGSVVEVENKPFFCRVIQHNGEAFDLLKRMGFNTIQLATTATSEQLRSARETGVWLICPPPPSTGLKPMGNFYDPVLAWTLGEGLQAQSVRAVQDLAREIRDNDSRRDRPLFANVRSHWMEYSQSADLLSVGLQPFGTVFPLNRYDEYVSGAIRSTGSSLPVLADIQTEHSRNVVQQAGLMGGRLPPLPISREQMETQVMQAVAGGSRGLRFLSRSRLDSSDPQTRLRVQTLTWINQRLQLLEPWVMGGVVMGQIPHPEANLQVTAIKTSRSQLLLIQQQTGLEQFVAGDSAIRTVRFQDTYSAIADQAYWLTDQGLMPLAQDRNAAGAMIQIDSCPTHAAVVLTQDPQVIQRLNQLYRTQEATSPVLLRSELTRQWLAFMQLVESECSRLGKSTPLASGSYNEALSAFQKADALIRSGSAVAAAPLLDVADQKLATTRRELLSLARDQFMAPISDPLVYHVSLLPGHWELANRMRNAVWNPNGLPGGDFENIQHMVNNGWRYSVDRDGATETEVALSPDAAIAGKLGMRLTASGSVASRGLVQSSPMLIESGPVRVKASQMVLISGWIRIDKELEGTIEGIVVYDSIGGREMGFPIIQTQGWQEFKLYRAVGEERDVRVAFELCGLGSVAIDEVTIRTVDLDFEITSPGASSATAPGTGYLDR